MPVHAQTACLRSLPEELFLQGVGGLLHQDVRYTVEPLYSDHHWREQNFRGECSGWICIEHFLDIMYIASLIQRVSLYQRWPCYEGFHCSEFHHSEAQL